MYTRATSIRSNFTNASLRHNNNHHVAGVSGATQLNHINNNYYVYMNSNNGNQLNVATSTSGCNGKRFSNGDLELKAVPKDPTRKIVFQPVRTASLKSNHHSTPPLRPTSVGMGGDGGGANEKHDGLFSDLDLSDAPLLSQIGEHTAGPQQVAGVGGREVQHVCQTGVCLNEQCPGIMFEDVDL